MPTVTLRPIADVGSLLSLRNSSGSSSGPFWSEIDEAGAIDGGYIERHNVGVGDSVYGFRANAAAFDWSLVRKINAITLRTWWTDAHLVIFPTNIVQFVAVRANGSEIDGLGSVTTLNGSSPLEGINESSAVMKQQVSPSVFAEMAAMAVGSFQWTGANGSRIEKVEIEVDYSEHFDPAAGFFLSFLDP